MAQPGPPPEVISIDHVILAVSDWGRSRSFYERALGAEAVELESGRKALRIGPTQLNVHLPADLASGENLARLPVRPGGSDICFQWDGPIAKAISHLKGEGVEIETGPVPRPGAEGMGTSVYFRDPDGSLLELISYE